MAKYDEIKQKNEEKAAKIDHAPRISDDEIREGFGEVKIARTPQKWTGKELLDALRSTGTGQNKLRTAIRKLYDNPNITAEEVLRCIALDGQRPAHDREPFGFNLHRATLTKARRLLEGYTPQEIASMANKDSEDAVHRMTNASRGDVILQADEQPLTIPAELLQVPA